MAELHPITGRPVPYELIPDRVYRVQHPSMATSFSLFGLQAKPEGRQRLFERPATEDTILEEITRHASYSNRIPSPFISLRTCGYHARNWGYLKSKSETFLYLVIDTAKLKEEGALFFHGQQPHELLICDNIPSSAILLDKTENLQTRLPIKGSNISKHYPGYNIGASNMFAGTRVSEAAWKLRYLMTRRDHISREEMDGEMRDMWCGELGRRVENGRYTKERWPHVCPYEYKYHQAITVEGVRIARLVTTSMRHSECQTDTIPKPARPVVSESAVQTDAILEDQKPLVSELAVQTEVEHEEEPEALQAVSATLRDDAFLDTDFVNFFSQLGVSAGEIQKRKDVVREAFKSIPPATPNQQPVSAPSTVNVSHRRSSAGRKRSSASFAPKRSTIYFYSSSGSQASRRMSSKTFTSSGSSESTAPPPAEVILTAGLAAVNLSLGSGIPSLLPLEIPAEAHQPTGTCSTLRDSTSLSATATGFAESTETSTHDTSLPPPSEEGWGSATESEASQNSNPAEVEPSQVAVEESSFSPAFNADLILIRQNNARLKKHIRKSSSDFTSQLLPEPALSNTVKMEYVTDTLNVSHEALEDNAILKKMLGTRGTGSPPSRADVQEIIENFNKLNALGVDSESPPLLEELQEELLKQWGDIGSCVVAHVRGPEAEEFCDEFADDSALGLEEAGEVAAEQVLVCA